MKNFIRFSDYCEGKKFLEEASHSMLKDRFQSAAYSVRRRETRVFDALQTMEKQRILKEEDFGEEDKQFSNILVPKTYFKNYPKDDVYISFSLEGNAKFFYKNVQCDVCNGLGMHDVVDPESEEPDLVNCEKCNGTGFVDQTILTFIPTLTDVATLFVHLKKDAPLEFIKKFYDMDEKRENIKSVTRGAVNVILLPEGIPGSAYSPKWDIGENTDGPKGWWISDQTLNGTYHIVDPDHVTIIKLAEKYWNQNKFGTCLWAGESVMGHGSKHPGRPRKEIYFSCGLKFILDDFTNPNAAFPKIISVVSYSTRDIITTVNEAISTSFGIPKIVPQAILDVGLVNQSNGLVRLAHKEEDAKTFQMNGKRLDWEKRKNKYFK